MGQVNVNPGGGRDDSGAAAAAGMSTGMMMVLLVGLILLLLLAWFVLRPVFFGGAGDVNVTIRSSDLYGLLALTA